MNNGPRNEEPTPLEAFSDRLDAARGVKESIETAPKVATYALGRAVRLGTEIVVALLVGMGLGVGLDYLTGASPLFLLLGMAFGFAAGILNVFRTLRELEPQETTPSETNSAED